MFDEYVELQQQHKQQQAALQQQGAQGGPAAAGSSGNTEHDSSKRIPWNKGRKHSALTIARIVSGNARARERPEVKAKMEAWSQSRIGVPLPEEVKEKIKQRSMEARLEKLRNMTPEEDAERRARIAQRSKSLWQDPEYAEKTTAAIRAAGAKRRCKPRLALTLPEQQQQQQLLEGEAAASGSGLTSSRQPKAQRAPRKAAASSSGEEVSLQQQQQPSRVKFTKKELAAAAAEQQRLLQQQVSRLLQMQQVIAASESTVAQLQRNLQAFENDPQAYNVASATMQQAQAHLATLHNQVLKLGQSLQQLGVAWEGSGQITHIAGMPQQQWLQRQLGAAAGSSIRSKGSTRKAPRLTSSSGAGSVDRAPMVRSRRSGVVSSGSSSSSSSSSITDADIVRSPRRQAAATAEAAGTGQAQKSSSSSSSNNSAAAAAARASAEAASSGGSRGSSSGSDANRQAGLSQHQASLNGSTAAAALNGANGRHQHVNGLNGHHSSSSSSSSQLDTMFVTVQVSPSEEEVADD